MKRNILLLLIVAVFIPKINLACECFSDPSSFCEDLFGENGEVFANFIVRAKVIEQIDFSKTVVVNTIIYGENLDVNELNIVSTSCGGPSELELDKEYIIALNKSTDVFYLIPCSVSYLEINNEIVEGKIAPNIESSSYSELKFVEGCANGFGTIFSINDMNIFPNPTVGEIEINTSGYEEFSLANFQVQIFDLTGKELTDHLMLNGILEEEVLKINLTNLSAGIYFLKLSDSFQKKTFRIVKQ